MEADLMCYMCDAAGNTREHAPPSSFFPTGYRENLVVVPSCPTHNLDNSRDVEYVRNLITQHEDVNEVALEHFRKKVLASYAHSPKLLERTFKNSKPHLRADGQETGIIPTDIERFDNIMEAITYALYYQDFGKTFTGKWNIWSISLKLPNGETDSRVIQMRQMFSLVQSNDMYIEKAVPQPKVFKYGYYPKDQNPPIYRPEFYEGFVVFALPETK